MRTCLSLECLRTGTKMFRNNNEKYETNLTIIFFRCHQAITEELKGRKVLTPGLAAHGFTFL